jgi:hypothetical protein
MFRTTNMLEKILLQASGQYEGIINRLEEQHKETLELLEMVSSPRYIDDIENIEHLFIAVMKGLSSLLYTLIRVTVGHKGTVAPDVFVAHFFNILFLHVGAYLLSNIFANYRETRVESLRKN